MTQKAFAIFMIVGIGLLLATVVYPATMLTAVMMPDTPTRATPAIHRSPPTPGERMPSLSGV